MPHQLLRKPRKPTQKPPPPLSPIPQSYTSELDYLHDINPSYTTGTSSSIHQPNYHSRSISHPKSGETRVIQSNASYRNFLARHLKSDSKYILDPFCRDKTSLGTYVEGRPLLKAYKPRGPDALPMRTIRTNNPIMTDIFEENVERFEKRNDFVFNDFLIKLSENENVSYHHVKSAMLSRHNYKQIECLLADLCLRPQNEIHTMDIDTSGITKVTPRIPQMQLLIEMAALVKQQMSEQMNTPMRTKIRSLPKYIVGVDFSRPMAHSEIVVYPDIRQGAAQPHLRGSTVNTDTLKSLTTGSLHGSNDQHPGHDMNFISQSELAILDSLMNGGVALSLKAHFICMLPNIEALLKSLVYLNLSFNDFKTIPFDTFDISHLTILKLRNNPIREITSDIAMLRNLKVLVISFCMLSALPLGLFTLKELEHLDVAYNRLIFIPNEVRKLSSLRTLNLEGNQLCAMPYGSLHLSKLCQLNVKANYMHPYFWRENSRNDPQRLSDLAALTYCRSGIENVYLNEYAIELLNRRVTCDCCLGAMYGLGLRVIRPVGFVFGIKHVPFLFHSCSPLCLEKFKAGLCDNDMYRMR